jgi:hypothetical protein
MFKNFTRQNQCGVFPIQNVLKSYPNTKFESTPNHTSSFSALYIFGYSFVCNQCMWQLARNILKLFPQPPCIITWHMYKFHVFLTLLPFFIFLKMFSHMFVVMSPELDVRNSFLFWRYILKYPDVQTHGLGQGLVDHCTTLRLLSRLDGETGFEAASPDLET